MLLSQHVSHTRPSNEYTGQKAKGYATQINGNIGTVHFNSQEDAEKDCLSALWQTSPSLTDSFEDRKSLIDKKGARVGGTCEWIRNNEAYCSWFDSSPQLLWLSGGPGKGKTMLSIFLAEELEQTVQQSKDAILIQYFCDNKDEKRNTAIAIL